MWKKIPFFWEVQKVSKCGFDFQVKPTVFLLQNYKVKLVFVLNYWNFFAPEAGNSYMTMSTVFVKSCAVESKLICSFMAARRSLRNFLGFQNFGFSWNEKTLEKTHNTRETSINFSILTFQKVVQWTQVVSRENTDFSKNLECSRISDLDFGFGFFKMFFGFGFRIRIFQNVSRIQILDSDLGFSFVSDLSPRVRIRNPLFPGKKLYTIGLALFVKILDTEEIKPNVQ